MFQLSRKYRISVVRPESSGTTWYRLISLFAAVFPKSNALKFIPVVTAASATPPPLASSRKSM